VRRRQTFFPFRSVPGQPPVVFRVFRDTVLEFDSTAGKASFQGVLNPSELRRRSTGSTLFTSARRCELEFRGIV
jgi:hypothetical protein